MANSRISAAMKDNIKKVYGKRIGEINDEIEERGKELAQARIKALEEEPKYKLFRLSIIEFCDWVKEADPDGEFSDSYNLTRAKDYLEDNTFFKTPYRSSLEKIFANDFKIEELAEEKERINKECSKLLWNLEMAPKSSEEYKDAYKKAEELLFGDK